MAFRRKKRKHKIVSGKAMKRFLIAQRDDYKCAYCGDGKPPLEIEHIIINLVGFRPYFNNDCA